VAIFLKSLPYLPKSLAPKDLLTFVRILRIPTKTPANPEPGRIYTFRYDESSSEIQTLLAGKILAIDSQNRLLTIGEGKNYQVVRIADQAEFYAWQKFKPPKEGEKFTPPLVN
jgi:hypothetical protein